jgi:hypothetical protein
VVEVVELEHLEIMVQQVVRVAAVHMSLVVAVQEHQDKVTMVVEEILLDTLVVEVVRVL